MKRRCRNAPPKEGLFTSQMTKETDIPSCHEDRRGLFIPFSISLTALSFFRDDVAQADLDTPVTALARHLRREDTEDAMRCS